MAQQRCPRQRGARGRHWLFTSFLDALPVFFDKNIVRYCCYQSEIAPETKRQHFQGYIEFFDDMRMGQVKSVLGDCHLEIRKASRHAAREYCRKKETSVPDSFVEFGIWRHSVSRKHRIHDMLKAKMSLDAIIEEAPYFYVRCYKGLQSLYSRRQKSKAKEFRKLNVLVFVGPTGTGKTERAMEEPDHFVVPSGDKLWFDGYEGESCLIIDDFGNNHETNGIKYSVLLRILDGYELQLPYKGGFIWAMWTKVIITSNTEPKDWYKVGLTDPLKRRLTHIIQTYPRVCDLEDDYNDMFYANQLSDPSVPDQFDL